MKPEPLLEMRNALNKIYEVTTNAHDSIIAQIDAMFEALDDAEYAALERAEAEDIDPILKYSELHLKEFLQKVTEVIKEDGSLLFILKTEPSSIGGVCIGQEVTRCADGLDVLAVVAGAPDFLCTLTPAHAVARRVELVSVDVVPTLTTVQLETGELRAEDTNVIVTLMYRDASGSKFVVVLGNHTRLTPFTSEVNSDTPVCYLFGSAVEKVLKNVKILNNHA